MEDNYIGHHKWFLVPINFKTCQKALTGGHNEQITLRFNTANNIFNEHYEIAFLIRYAQINVSGLIDCFVVSTFPSLLQSIDLRYFREYIRKEKERKENILMIDMPDKYFASTNSKK